MNTSKPIACISYNSTDFLNMTLKQLHELHIISDYMYIFHKHEEDEKKDHIHLWMRPNTKIDTIEIQNRFKEFDPNFDKPLGITDPKPSDIDNWILYGQHFKPYLISKLEDRVHYYQKSDFVYCDEDTFEENYYHAFHSSDWAKQTQINTLLNDPDFNRSDLVLSGVLPLSLSSSLLALLNLEISEKNGHTERAGRKNHD